MLTRFKVAVIQAAPVVFDRGRTLQKVQALAGDAARAGARLVLFPEAFVSGYPRGMDFGAVVGARTDAGREEFRRYWESSMDVPGPDVRREATRRGSSCREPRDSCIATETLARARRWRCFTDAAETRAASPAR